MVCASAMHLVVSYSCIVVSDGYKYFIYLFIFFVFSKSSVIKKTCLLVMSFWKTSSTHLPLFAGGFEGAIELSILADYYGREIAAYDIQTTRCDLYGQVQN